MLTAILRVPLLLMCLLVAPERAPAGDACCPPTPASTSPAHAEEAPPALDAHGHAAGSHAEEAGDPLHATEQDRRTKRCEHEKLTAECDACCAEVGVVAVGAELLTPPGGGAPLVSMGAAHALTIADTVETFGLIAFDEGRASHVSPRVSGVIGAVHHDLGDVVATGDPLFDLQSVDLGRAAADYLKALSLARLAERDLDRGKQLFKQRVTSEKEVFRLEFDRDQAVIERDAARRRLQVLGVTDEELSEAESSDRTLRGRTCVRAPVAGTVVQKHAVTGELVEAGKDVILLADLTRVWVWAQLHDHDLGTLLAAGGRGTPAAVTVDAYPGQSFEGTVDHVSPVVDADTRTVRVRVVVPNQSGKLLPGMFCRVSMQLGYRHSLAVPQAAVLTDGATAFVFKTYSPGRFAAQPIQTGHRHGARVEVLAGLALGDAVVAEGAFLLKSELLKARMGAG